MIFWQNIAVQEPLARAGWPGPADPRRISEGILQVQFPGVTKEQTRKQRGFGIGTIASSAFLVSSDCAEELTRIYTDSGAKSGLFCGGKIPSGGNSLPSATPCTVPDQGEFHRELGRDHRREGCRNIKEGKKDIKYAYGFKREEKSRFRGKQKSWVTVDRKQSNAQSEAQSRVSFSLRSWGQLTLCPSKSITDQAGQVPARAEILQEQPLFRGDSRDSKSSHQKPWKSLCAAREGLERSHGHEDLNSNRQEAVLLLKPFIKQAATIWVPLCGWCGIPALLVPPVLLYRTEKLSCWPPQ